MAHDHHHHHHHTDNKKVLGLSFLIITAFMIVEVIGGIWTNSLALLSDAGHMLSDSISLAIALLAFQFSSQAPDANKTFGSKRFEILAAIINGVTL
ncbi:cation diffusion facilitator family transporter, partial [Exiguobacterium indicum]